MTTVRHVLCPICGSSAARNVGTPCYTSPKIERMIPSWRDIHIVRCKQCGFYYTSPMPIWSDHDLDTLYDATYCTDPNDWWTATRENDARSRLSLLARHMNCSEPTFLDVGCGYGHVLGKAVERGWHTYGLDPSAALVLQARDRLGVRAGIHVEKLEDSTFPSGFFDVIHMDSVLEHVPDAQTAAEALYRLLKRDGVAYILVPNEDRLAYASTQLLLRVRHRARETPKLSPLSSPYHIVGFNKRSFQYLFTKNGFAVRYVHVFRGVEPWRKVKTTQDTNLKGRIYRQFETLCWSLGGLLGRGAMIEAVVQKT